MKTTKKQRERARRIREIVEGRWCWACRGWGASKGMTSEEAMQVEPCNICHISQHDRFRRRRIGRKEVVP
jgi:hypothetical protein